MEQNNKNMKIRLYFLTWLIQMENIIFPPEYMVTEAVGGQAGGEELWELSGRGPRINADMMANLRSEHATSRIVFLEQLPQVSDLFGLKWAIVGWHAALLHCTVCGALATACLRRLILHFSFLVYQILQMRRVIVTFALSHRNPCLMFAVRCRSVN